MSQARHKKYQKDSKAEFTGCPSKTESGSDSAEGTESKDEVSASSVIYSSKTVSSLWKAAKLINYGISKGVFSF